MPAKPRFLWVALATGMMVVPTKARARARTLASLDPPRPPAKQNRRRAEGPRAPQDLAPQTSPQGRHIVNVREGAVYVDGRRVHPDDGVVHVLSKPVWRADGRALAWLERHEGRVRLVVLPALGADVGPLMWELPAGVGREDIAWAGTTRVVVGPQLLEPRAIASWSET